MKKIITLLFLLTVLISLNNKSFAQPNSVSLNGTTFFSNIEAAYAAITAGFVTPQLVEILPVYDGTSELFPITLNLIAGTSTITIRPAAGNNGEVISSTTVNNYLFFLQGCNNVIIDGRPGGVTSTPANYLSVNNGFNTAANGNAGTIVFNGADNCTYQYINATAAPGTLAFTGARTINIAGAAGNPSHNNVVQNCVVRGGLRGIQNFGFDGSNINQSCIIRNNDIADFFNWGMLISFDNNSLIQSNSVHFTAAITTVAGFLVGIQIQGNNTSVNQNDLFNFNSLNSHSHLHIANFGAGNSFTRNNIHNNIPNAAQTNVATGFQLSGTGNTYCAENQIYDLSLASPGTVLGINIASNGAAIDTSLTIENNKIWNLFTTSTSRIEGIRCVPKTNNVVYITNNNIAIRGANNGASGIFGIWATNSSLVGADTTSKNYTANINSNSIYISGVNLGTVGFFVNSAGILRDNFFPLSVYNQYDNDVINKRITGDLNFQVHLGFWIDTLTGTLGLNNNNYFASDPNLGFAAFWDDSLFTNADIVSYHGYAAPQEANTTFGNLSFLKLTLNFEACPNLSAVTVELREAASPYNLVESSTGMAGGDFPNVINFSTVTDGTPYYIVVKSANMVETWSASTVVFTDKGSSYDFTASLAAAFGSNQKMVLGIPSVYQGDANQDGFVNLTDVNLVYNASAAFQTSSSTDFNCDDITDVTDVILASNNNNAFVQKVTPPVLAPSTTPVVTKTAERTRIQLTGNDVLNLKVNGSANTEANGVGRYDR